MCIIVGELMDSEVDPFVEHSYDGAQDYTVGSSLSVWTCRCSTTSPLFKQTLDIA